MFKDFEETFTNDLRFRNEIISLENGDIELFEETEKEQPFSYTQEEIELVWTTLAKICNRNSNKYIMTYLIFYLGYSYRDAADVLGIALAWGHDLVKSSIADLRKELKKDYE